MAALMFRSRPVAGVRCVAAGDGAGKSQKRRSAVRATAPGALGRSAASDATPAGKMAQVKARQAELVEMDGMSPQHAMEEALAQMGFEGMLAEKKAAAAPKRKPRAKSAATAAAAKAAAPASPGDESENDAAEKQRQARLARMKRAKTKKSQETVAAAKRKAMLSGSAFGRNLDSHTDYMSVYEQEFAELQGKGLENSQAAQALMSEVEARFRDEEQERFWEEEAKRNPLREINYAGRSDEAVEAEATSRRAEMASKGWDADMDYEQAIEAFRNKFSKRRATGMMKVREKYHELKLEAEENGEDLVYTKTKTSGDLTDPSELEQMSLNTSVDPERVAPGEYIVHKKYGVGQFLGMKKLPVSDKDGETEEVMYMFLKYGDGTAKLKASQAHRLLYRYRTPGAGDDGTVKGKGPRLSKLYNTEAWQKRCERGRKGIRSLVMNVMEVYMQRMQMSRQPYPQIAPESNSAFEEAFPYSLTPDQAGAVEELQLDLSTDTPMDRLVIGDVGFGKTEVAMRAIFRVAQAGGQVFVLCPTTLLAKQHAKLIQRRLEPFGHKVELLNRYSTSKQRAATLASITDGTLSVCVGTQSLLSKEVDYSHVSMLVIDEEQRFGVAQKESISALKSQVDVLTMSATPIPRTMHMAVAGFRDTSLITTPPPERRPIKTQVSHYDPDLVKEVVKAELDRDGQVFYIVPRVSMIPQAQARLEEMMPDIRVMSAHGRLNGAQQEDVMDTFSQGDCDVLVCTTIVEAGLDLPRVNTIIIDNVHMFGLATLYQLRGRVGRSDKEAYAYMMWPKLAKLSSEAQERLLAIQECCQLGDGFRLAERDMAIRGVGTIFGLKQSGDVDNVGMDLYLEMLHEELQKVEKQRLPRVALEEVSMLVSADLTIPDEYIKSEAGKQEVRLAICDAASKGPLDVITVVAQIEAAYGPLPQSVRVMVLVENMRKLAADLGIHSVQITRSMASSAVFETALAEESFDMIRDAVPQDVADAIEWRPDGKIRARLPMGMEVERLSERTWSILDAMRQSLPSFVKYM